jgi:hypothetical protein
MIIKCLVDNATMGMSSMVLLEVTTIIFSYIL